MTALEIVQFLGSIGEFLGAIAVFATLLYLSIQIRAADRTAQFSAVAANRSHRIISFAASRDSPYLPGIQLKLEMGEPLTPEEKVRLTSHYASQWALLYSEWTQREMDVMGEFATSDDLTTAIMFASPSAMEWWEAAGRRIYPKSFQDYIDGRSRKFDDRDVPRSNDSGNFLPRF